MNTKILGTTGEILAKEYLQKQGYKILKTNFSCKLGEIDIIAQKNDRIIFIEVKARTSAKFGYPREAVTIYKQNKIRQVAMIYLQQTNNTNSNLRFDVIEILGEKITHLENAF